MKKKLAMVSAAATMALAGTGAALAGGQAPGTPGEANCQGQQIAFLNEIGKSLGLHGLKETANALGFSSVKDFQDANAAYCG